jgi:hypothetical protein
VLRRDAQLTASLQRMTHLVSIAEASRQLGHDPRTIRKVVGMAEARVVTRIGALYSLDELRHLLFVPAPHLRRPVRQHMVQQFTDI